MHTIKKINHYIRYTNAIDQLYKNLDTLFQNKIFQNRKLYVFGSSKVTGMIVSYLENKMVKLEGIIDNNLTCIGNTIFGLKIFAPTILADTWDDKTLVLIVSSHQDSMIQQLENMGYLYETHIIKVLDLPKAMKDYSFIDRTGYIPLSDEEVRESQLNILRCAKKICEKYGFRYYMAYGTLLGAVRHKGFIPWDDDIDIYIDIDDFTNFINSVNEEPDFGIASSAIDMDYYDMVSLLYDYNNICDSNRFPMQISAGVTIDVFPLFGLPDNKKEIQKYMQELKKAEQNMLNHMHYSTCKEAKEHLFQLMQKYDIKKSKYVGNLLSTYQSKEIFFSEWFGDGTMLEFERESFCAPINYDSYLHKIYGNYMQLPPENQRQNHHFFHVYHNKKDE